MTTTSKNSGKTTSLLTGLLILAFGVILILCNKMITGKGIIILAGILFLVTGIVNLVLYVTRKDADGRRINRGFTLFFGWLVSIAAIILGLCMLVFTGTFSALIPFIFGILIFFGAIMLAFNFVTSGRHVVSVPGWLWFIPGVILVLGIITICQKPDVNDPLIMILTGVSMLLFGLGGIVAGTIMASARRRAVNVTSNSATQAVKKIEEGESSNV